MHSANNWKRRPRNEAGGSKEKKIGSGSTPTVSDHHIALSCGAQRLNELL